ncbi:MAG: prepilin-type N-terminal cleavage/methylation domain-containing protein [bacterium]|nr:prepilin-type N-terminal cleavage/methylation domain-containing protein [bacterium]
MNNTNRAKRFSKGFTIIELMIATVIFSLLLLICLNALVQISRAYYKGISSSKAQEAARSIADELSQSIQLSSDRIMSTIGPAGPQVTAGDDASGILCVGYRSYTYAIDRQAVNNTSAVPVDKEIRNVMVRRDLNTCCDQSNANAYKVDLTNPISGSDKSMVGENMRLSRLRVAPVAGTDGRLWEIQVAIVYGDTDLIDVDPSNSGRVICRSGTGTEFCALAEVNTVVKRRFGSR